MTKFCYKNEVEVTDGFFKGEHGIVLKFYSWIFDTLHEYLIKLDDGEFAYIKEKWLK